MREDDRGNMVTETELNELKTTWSELSKQVTKLAEKHETGAKGKDGFPVAGWFDEGKKLQALANERDEAYALYNEAAHRFYNKVTTNH